jgi:thioredoxin-related protein
MIRYFYVTLLLIAVCSLVSCVGHTKDALQKTLHNGIDIGFSVYDDGKEIYDAAKKLVLPASPAEPTK